MTQRGIDPVADVLSVVGDAVVRFAADGTVVWASPSLSTVLGYDPDEVVGQRLPVADPADHAAAAERVRDAIRDREPEVRARVRAVRTDGRRVWLDTVTRLVWSDGDVPEGYVTVMRDVTEQVADEQDLREARERLALVLDSSRMGLWDWHMQTGEVVFNERWAQIIGYTLADLAPITIDTWVRLAHPGDLAASDALIAAHERGETEYYELDCRMRHRDGYWVWVRDRGRIVERDAVGRPLRMTGTHEDITAVKQAIARLEASESRYRVLTESMQDVVWVMDAETLRPLYVSPSVERLRGFTAEELMAAPVDDALASDAAVRMRAQMAERVRAVRAGTLRPDEFFVDDLEQPCADGSTVWTEVITSYHLDEKADRVEVWGVTRDISQRRAAQDAQAQALADLERSEQRFRTAMQFAPAGMAVVTLDREFAEVNPALCRILGRPAEWLLGRRIDDVLDEADLRTDRTMRAHALGSPDAMVSREHRMVRCDGERIWVEHSIGVLRDPDGEPSSYVSQFIDVTEARQAREQLRHRASHDPLTNLVNRHELIDRIEDLLARKPRVGVNVALLFIDLDNLKPINDTHGHAAGDTVIATVAERLRSAVRADDVVARIGGDEFVIVLTTITSVADAAAVAEKIHDRAAAPVDTDRGAIAVTVSIGLALVEPGDNPESALQRADAALYQAKEQGRARTVIHRPTIPQSGTE